MDSWQKPYTIFIEKVQAPSCGSRTVYVVVSDTMVTHQTDHTKINGQPYRSNLPGDWEKARAGTRPAKCKGKRRLQAAGVGHKGRVYPGYDNYNGQTHNGSLRVHTGEGNNKIPNHQALRLYACGHVHATAGPLLNTRCTGTAGNKMPVTIAKAFTIARGWSGMAHDRPLAFHTFFTIHIVGNN